jgi:predicted dehydrogenase
MGADVSHRDALRVGVIGLGTIGRTHLAALRQAGIAELAGADPSPLAREAARRSFGIADYSDYRRMLDDERLTAVVVATPPRTHRELALLAIERGLGVLCEKPLALTVEECEDLVAAAQQAQRPFAVGFCHRFQPQVQSMRAMLLRGDLGAPILFHAAFVHGLTETDRSWLKDPAQAGGGVLVDSGSHAIDLFRYIIGEVHDVRGLTDLGFLDPGTVENSCVAVLRSGAVVGGIELSWRAPPWEGCVEVVGDGGRARVDYDGQSAQLHVRAQGAGWQQIPTDTTDRFAAQVAHFLACLRGDAAPLATAADGLEATRTWLRLYAQLDDPAGPAEEGNAS